MKNKQQIEEEFKLECSILKNEGQLIDDWSNVYDHCISEAIVASCVSDLLKLPKEQSTKLISAAILHDWYKRVERTSGRYDESAKESYDKLLALGIDEYVVELAHSVGHTSISDVANSNDFLKKVMHYIDDVTLNDKLVELDERMDSLENSEKYRELNESGRKIYGRTYFEMQRELGKEIEKEIETRTNLTPKTLISEIKKRVFQMTLITVSLYSTLVNLFHVK